MSIQAILQATQLRDFMIKPVITIRETEEFHVVKDKMETHGIRHLPVVNEAGILVGIITERYLYKIHSPRKLDNGSFYYDKSVLDSFILKNVMIKDPVTLKPESSLKEAMQAMAALKFACIIVVDDDRIPCGIVTRKDVIKFLLMQP